MPKRLARNVNAQWHCSTTLEQHGRGMRVPWGGTKKIGALLRPCLRRAENNAQHAPPCPSGSQSDCREHTCRSQRTWQPPQRNPQTLPAAWMSLTGCEVPPERDVSGASTFFLLFGSRLVLQGGHPMPCLSPSQDGKPPGADRRPWLSLGKPSSSSQPESDRPLLANPHGNKARSSCLQTLLCFREQQQLDPHADG